MFLIRNVIIFWIIESPPVVVIKNTDARFLANHAFLSALLISSSEMSKMLFLILGMTSDLFFISAKII